MKYTFNGVRLVFFLIYTVDLKARHCAYYNMKNFSTSVTLDDESLSALLIEIIVNDCFNYQKSLIYFKGIVFLLNSINCMLLIKKVKPSAMSNKLFTIIICVIVALGQAVMYRIENNTQICSR